MGTNPAVYWMDVSKASYYIYNEKKNNKGSQMGHTKKLKRALIRIRNMIFTQSRQQIVM